MNNMVVPHPNDGQPNTDVSSTTFKWNSWTETNQRAQNQFKTANPIGIEVNETQPLHPDNGANEDLDSIVTNYRFWDT